MIFAIQNQPSKNYDLVFEDNKIWNVNISETVRAGAKMHGTAFRDFYIQHRTASLQTLYSCDIDLFFEGKQFETLISMKPRELEQKCV